MHSAHMFMCESQETNTEGLLSVVIESRHSKRSPLSLLVSDLNTVNTGWILWEDNYQPGQTFTARSFGENSRYVTNRLFSLYLHGLSALVFPLSPSVVCPFIPLTPHCSLKHVFHYVFTDSPSLSSSV